MGKAEQRQAKLSFEGGRRKGGAPASQSEGPATDEENSDGSVKAMFLDLKTSLAGIDGKLDHVTEQLDRIKTRVDEHDARLDQLEVCTSVLEDTQRGLPESTDMGRMEDFVEEMLSDLFPGQLSRLLVVERAHRSLGPRPRLELPRRSLAQTAARFSLIYPAKLKVQHGGSLQFFTDLKLVAKYAKSLPWKSEAVPVAESAAERESLSDND
ncbi:hypothetical protein NDU88_002904 [Pleurodeles waltl]|uniref:Uncharacterized protein n=1 Tax=Pleurodeles waltl TaxID=8319 RepID=A0AAV7T3I6_PLEWA|nr:hypothetical protein NDU88_002904 [Pleurodeles waltl]